MKYRHSIDPLIVKAGYKFSNSSPVSEQAEGVIVMVPLNALGAFTVMVNGLELVENGMPVTVGAGQAVVLRGTIPTVGVRADTVMDFDCEVNALYDSYTA